MKQRLDTQHILAIALAGAVALHPGCSFLALTPPPAGARPSVVAQESAPCTRRLEAPVWDTVGVVAFGTLGLLITPAALELRKGAKGSSPMLFPDLTGLANAALTLGIGALVLAAVTAVSGVYGYTTVATCREMYPLPRAVQKRRTRRQPSLQPVAENLGAVAPTGAAALAEPANNEAATRLAATPDM
jgi:hypothetical protein